MQAYLGGGLGLGLDAGADLGGEHSLLFVVCVQRVVVGFCVGEFFIFLIYDQSSFKGVRGVLSGEVAGCARAIAREPDVDDDAYAVRSITVPPPNLKTALSFRLSIATIPCRSKTEHCDILHLANETHRFRS